MTTDMVTVRDLVEKSPDADLLREMIGFAAERQLHVVTAYGRATPPTQRALAFRAYCRQMAAGLQSSPSQD